MWLFGGGNPFAGPRTSLQFGNKGANVSDIRNILQGGNRLTGGAYGRRLRGGPFAASARNLSVAIAAATASSGVALIGAIPYARQIGSSCARVPSTHLNVRGSRLRRRMKS